ncbi:MinD/ParA family protein [Streptomyces decoyicus]|uniref:MinD/ParA family ATP-binding protein n=1 Tax=Streptomyces decoyicus TaxID=249567 RepID=UPI00362C6B4E
MPNGDDWQGDVLRDLRGGAQQAAQGPGGQAYSTPAPDPGLPAQSPQAPYTVAQRGGQAGHPYQGQGQQTGHQGGGPQQAGYQEQRQQAPAAYAPGSQPHSAPGSRPVVDEGLAGAVRRKPRHGESVTARAVRALRRTLSSSAAREVAEITRTAEVLQRPVTTGRQIAVTSIRGGSGKSTVAALLGTTYAHYRQDPVLFLEADPALGSLPLRLGAETVRWTTSDVADIVTPNMSLLDVTGYLVQLPDNAWLLPASQGQIGVMLDSRAYERAVVALRRYFGVMVVDCETLPAEVARVALAAAHGRVLTAPATPDGLTSTYSVLQWMQGLPPHVIAGTVVVLTELVPHSGLDLDRATRTIESTGASVQVLPYDRHLAAGGPVRTELLAHPTREAAARLAADVFHLSQKRH